MTYRDVSKFHSTRRIGFPLSEGVFREAFEDLSALQVLNLSQKFSEAKRDSKGVFDFLAIS